MKPNILIILADDLGVDALRINPTTGDVAVQLDGAGGKVTGPKTLPNLSKLAKSGIRFTRAWAQPVCSPTRASLFTGTHPWRNGVGYPEPAGNSTIPVKTTLTGVPIQGVAEVLSSAGYSCGIFGKWHVGMPKAGEKRTPTQWGWDRFEGIYEGGFRPVGAQIYGLGFGLTTLQTLAATPPGDAALAPAVKTALVEKRKAARAKCEAYFREFCPDHVDALNAPNDLRHYIWEKSYEDKPTNTTQRDRPPADRVHLYSTKDQIYSAKTWIQQMNGKTWCVALTLTAPHEPFHVPPKESYTITFANPKAPTVQEMFVAMVESMDFYLGKLLNAAEPEIRSQLNNTVIVFAGDNGTEDDDTDTGVLLDEDIADKGTHNIGGVHVPMIICDGGSLSGGTPCYLKDASGQPTTPAVSSSLVHIVDIYKTVIDIAGGTVTGEVDHSLSLKPYLQKTGSDLRKYNFSQQFPKIREVSKFATITDGKFKLSCVRTAYKDGGAGDTYGYELSELAPHDKLPGALKETPIQNFLVAPHLAKVLELHAEMKKHYLDGGDPLVSPPRTPLPFPGLAARLWAIQTNGVWTRHALESNRWDIYSEARLAIVADPTTAGACYFINPDGTVHWRNVDQNLNKSFPGITAKQISVGGGGRLWAIQTNGVWTRYAPELNRWDIYSEARLDIAADPTTAEACYFINPDGTVHWRNVDKNISKSFPGITAKQISAGGR